MASPLELLNQASYDARRRGVTYMPPVRIPPPPRAGPPITPRLAPNQQIGQGGGGDWVTPNFGAIANYAPTPARPAGGGGNQFGGLGYVIGGLGKVGMGALNALDYGRRAAVLGTEEYAKLAPDALEILNPLSLLVNENRDDQRSALERLRDPSYGWGQIAKQIDTGSDTFDKWANRAYGLAGDVALDPLTYLSFGVGGVAGKTGRAGALTRLGEKQLAAVADKELVEELGRQWARRAGGTMSREAETAYRKTLQEATERAARLGGEKELELIGQKGLSYANPEQLAEMGLKQHSMRFMGQNIPGTEGISRALSVPAQRLRPVARGLPGAAALREMRTPLGYFGQDLNPAYERIISGTGEGTMRQALESVAFDNMARESGGTFEALANRELRILREQMKTMSHSEQQAMIREAERGADNAFSQYAAKVREAAKEAGADIPELKPVSLADGGVTQYAMPHVLSRQFRDYLQGAAKGKYDVPAANVFKKEAGITTEDLLEEGGFLQQRRFVPQEEPYKFGDREITIEEGTIDELNRKFKALFPEFDGPIYETDPTTAWRHYINKTRTDVADRAASARAEQRGFDTFMRDPGKPNVYDPLSGRRQVTTRLEEGKEVPVVVPEANRQPMMTPEQEAVYKTTTTKETERLTRERNQAVRGRNADIGRAREYYAETSLAGRQKIAAGLDELTAEVYAPIREELDRLEEVAKSGNVAAGQMIAEWRAATERRAEIPKEMGQLTRQINKIEQGINKVRSMGDQLVPKAQKEMLDMLEQRRVALLEQRRQLIETFEMDLQTTPTTRALHSSAIEQLGEQAINTHTKKLTDTARKAKQAYDDEVARLMSSSPGVLQPEQLLHYQRIVDAAPQEVRDVARRRGGLGRLMTNKTRIDEEVASMEAELARRQRTINDTFGKMSDEELTSALEDQRSLKQQIDLMKQESQGLKESIKSQKGQDVLTRAEADYDEAFRALRRHYHEVRGAGGIEEGVQPLLAAQRLAEHNLREWQVALATQRPRPSIDPITDVWSDFNRGLIDAAERDRRFAAIDKAGPQAAPAEAAVPEVLTTPEGQQMGQWLDRLAEIETERGNWMTPEQIDEKLKGLRADLRKTERGATEGTPTERMALRNERGDIRRAIEAAERDREQSVKALKELDKEQRAIARKMAGKSKLREAVEQARRGPVEEAPEAQRGIESAAQRRGRVRQIENLRRDRATAETLLEQARTEAAQPAVPTALKRVRGGWYKNEEGFQIIRNDEGVWQIVNPGEFQPSGEWRTLAEAQKELSERQANPEWVARRTQQGSRVPEYERQIANINQRLSELEHVGTPLGEGIKPTERTIREPPPRTFGGEAPPPLHPKLREIEQQKSALRQERGLENIEQGVLAEHMPAIHQTEMELANVAERLGGVVEGTGGKMPRAEMEAAGVAINEAHDAIDMINNLTGTQMAKQSERQALEAEKAALPQRIEEAQQGYLGTLQSQEAARAENARVIESVGGEFLPPDNATRRVARNKKQAKAFGTRLDAVKAGGMAAEDAQPLNDVLVQINKLIDGNPLGNDTEMMRLQRLAEGFRDELAKLTTETDLPAHEMEKMVKAAQRGKLAPVVDFTLKDGIERMGGSDILVSSDVRRMYYRVREGTRSKGFGRLMKMYTDFFKTYATLSPGFHVRNALSAIFMNFTEGVPTGTQMRGVKLWREFANSEEPIEFLRALRRTDPAAADAFRAVFASGSGGQFFEAGVGSLSVGSTRVREGVFANRLTKGSQRFGQDWVEGPVRLGLALDSTTKGRGVEDALNRITRVHFDYSQVSSFDEKAKKYIPFWTYMSRNLPLQITQMWTKPKVYAWYNSFKRNVQVPTTAEFMPQYIEQAGGFQTGTTPDWMQKIPFLGTGKDMPFVLQPDLPHARVLEDINRFAGAASGQNAGQLLSDFNPAFTAPLEFLTSQDFYTGRQYQPDDYVKAGIADLPFLPLGALLGETKVGPGGVYMSEKARNTARALVPPYDRAVRMIPGLAGGSGEQNDRQLESFARFLGLPIRTISDKQQQSEQARRFYEARDQARVLAALGGG